MDKDLINKYRNEMLKMYRGSNPAKQTAAQPYTPGSGNTQPQPDTKQQFSGQQGFYAPGAPYEKQDASDSSGRLSVMVSAANGILPVPGARVTVFTGTYEQPEIIATDITDESGKTKVFELYAPPRSLSMTSGQTEQPYTLYSVLVEADGFASNLHLNVPVFMGVTSMQKAAMTPKAALGNSAGPIVYNVLSKYPL